MSTHVPRRRRRRPQQDGEARTRILDAAEKLFATHGFDATATASIAAAADVPKGLIFYYFPTKEAILETLVAERMPTEPIDDVNALVEPGDPAASLVNLDTALNLRDHRSSVLRVIIWREADTHPDIRSHLYRLRSHLHDITVRLLQASAPGPVQPGTLRACATAWVSAMFSAASTDRWLDLDGLPRNREDLRTVARVIAAGMTGMGKLSFG
ncbi:TetR/AcrR family transcriptional regulator [Rhodococcus sp. NPDC003382]|uniref:TetR/AcrR family transcriptional regulator n=1 Tax=unclassified Rhodococcus (in: high G+C Gram-positive bacteria) TaxID=192944 RepID=UPI0018CCC0E2|nr:MULTISPECIES: TetR/AcrR family transcriptional regulator [unclassified Rhodococcus (in: high G+C Gram-positive bacteria)]MBH0123371.1 TetR/AcrR family transcriptional regulator [Rhodococcus sp. CX]MCK8674326.1 TetR/AcrR family transcriptional regulator [Rhodococcus sp. HM1]